jgi:transcription elongation GreA/GreB family factor
MLGGGARRSDLLAPPSGGQAARLFDPDRRRPTVSSPPARTSGKVRLGFRAVYRDEPDGDVESATIVAPNEADFASGRLSATAPLGAALLGRRVDEVVRVRTPGGLRVVRILSAGG